jgi:penicillin V acylase-like amidase (Ntn superfamily)
MEGIAVDEDSKIVYVSRERNKKQQSEIHFFFVSEKGDSLYLNYQNQTLIQHKNRN